MRSGGRPRVGARTVLLLVSASGVALVLAWGFDTKMAESAITLVVGLPALYIAWASFRSDRAEALAADLDTAAEQLAVAVRAQWNDEAAVRRVNDPYPLPIAWRAAADDLAEPWMLLTDLARAWPGGPPGDPALWPQDSGGLAGQDAQIGQVFTDRVPTRRLVILGEPGAGKSVLLIRLLQDLIERRTGSVPVLFSLASWNPRQPLKVWLADQLRRTHSGLRAPAPTPLRDTTSAGEPADLAQALLETGRILPLLDGFDELPPAWHATALDALNRSLPARWPLLLAARVAPYRAALTRPGITVRLNGAAAIQLLPLTAQSATAYLRRDAGGPHTPAAHRWDAVTAHLGTVSPVGQALSTPLGLFLARTIYNPRPLIPLHPAAPHPDELCDPQAFPNRTSIDTHLFRAYIPAAYTSAQPRPPHWSADQAHRAFVFLARFLHDRRGGSPDLAWWELPRVLPVSVRRLTAGMMTWLVTWLVAWLVTGLATGLATGLVVGLLAGSVTWLVTGLATGLATWLATWLVTWHVVRFVARLVDRIEGEFVTGFLLGFTFGILLGLTALVVRFVGGFGRRPHVPHTRLRWRPWGLVAALTAGLTVMLMYGSQDGLAPGVGQGFMVTLSLGLVAGFKREEADLTAISGPVTQLILARRAFVAAGLLTGLGGALGGIAVGSVADAIGAFSLGQSKSVATVTGAVVGGIWMGLGTELRRSAWPPFVMARTYLVLRRKIPRNLMAFLQDAHEHRGVLRQVGAVYQFRHIDLQRHLARQQA